MLIYHPAFDAYHCVFRMLVITDRHRILEFSKLRILDFYLCFPAELALVQLPKEHIEVKKIAKAVKNPYRGPVSAHRAFRELEPIQATAARLLALSGVFSISELEASGKIVRTGQQLPDALVKSVEDSFEKLDDVQRYVLSKMAALPLQGMGGLKQRTDLMEHRYDVV